MTQYILPFDGFTNRYPTIAPFTYFESRTVAATLQALTDEMVNIIDEVNKNNVEILDTVVDLLNSTIDQVNTALTQAIDAIEVDTDQKIDGAIDLITNLTDGLGAQVSALDVRVTALEAGGDSPNIINPVGSVTMFAGSTAPTGWLKCDGATLLRAEYPDLFAAIGEAYGGNGSTTFALPNLENRVPVGVSTSKSLGDTGGNESTLLSIANMPSHNHGGTTGQAGAHGHTATVASGGDHNHTATTASAGGHSHSATVSGNGAHRHTATTSSAGSHRHDVGSADFYFLTGKTGSGGGAARRTINRTDGDHSAWTGVNSSDLGSSAQDNAAGAHTHTITTDTTGTHTGAHTHTATTATAGAHTHTATVANGGAHTHSATVSSVADHAHTIATQGESQALSLMQPFIVLNFIIKY